MAQLWQLTIASDMETVVQIIYGGASIWGYRLMEGGFDIGLPATEYTFLPTTDFRHRILGVERGIRTATIKLEVYGTDRNAAMEKLHTLERHFNYLELNTKYSGWNNYGILTYAWTGVDYLTYFEVYGGKISLPSDIMSVEKIHYRDSDYNYVIPDITVTLYLSALGYKHDPRTDVGDTISIENDNGGPITGGLVVDNATGCNWIQPASGVTIPGTGPAIVSLQIENADTSDLNPLSAIFVGLHPDRSAGLGEETLVFDEGDAVRVSSGSSSVADINAYGGNFRDCNFGSAAFFDELIAFEPDWYSSGLYYVFLHQFYWSGYYVPSGDLLYAASIVDSNYAGSAQGDRFRGHMGSVSNGLLTMPIGPIPLPDGDPMDDLTFSVGDHLNQFSIYWAGPSGVTGQIGLDYVSLLPITWGFRMYTFTGWNPLYNWYMIDYGTRDIVTALGRTTLSGSYGVAAKPIPYYKPLLMYPSTAQRLWFQTISKTSDNTMLEERNRQLKVTLSLLPTYTTLAE